MSPSIVYPFLQQLKGRDKKRVLFKYMERVSALPKNETLNKIEINSN